MPNPITSIFGNRNNPVNIKRQCYAIASVNGSHADITMYGVVVSKRPVDWETGEPLAGDFIVKEEFMEDLKAIEDAKTITIRMDSVGGDVYAALPIHNRLMELKAEVTVIIDGVAMSAASFIMCAADKVKVNAASIVMIHKASLFLFFTVMNADHMREAADFLDTVDETIASAYIRKSGLSKEDVLSMMGKETYMTGEEAVEKGFADELMENSKQLNIAASADKSTLFINGRAMHLPENFSPGFMKDIPTVEPAAVLPDAEEINQNQSAQSDERKVGNTMAKNLEELKAENPELAAQLIAEAQTAASAELSNNASSAAEAERKRLQEIDEVSALFDEETVRDAKYGDKPCTAQEMTHRAAVKAAKEGKSFMKDVSDDATASGANDVSASGGGNNPDAAGEKTEEQKKADAKAEVQKLLGKKEG